MAHITFIHGIANKPHPAELLRLWKYALATSANPLDLDASGVSYEMVYWADVLHSAPIEEDELESDAESLEGSVLDDGVGFKKGIPDPTESAWVDSLRKKIGVDAINDDAASATLPESAKGTFAEGLERIPLPWSVKKLFLKSYLRDVHHYLFNETHSPRAGETFQVQDEIRHRFLTALQNGATRTGPHLVVSHSMGTVIAYDCLKRLENCPKIDHLITIGSPLGITEIQDKLKPEWTRADGFPAEKINGSWSNFYDPLDVVSRLDPKLANDYQRGDQEVVLDNKQSGEGAWRHDIELYLRGNSVSSEIGARLGISFT